MGYIVGMEMMEDEITTAGPACVCSSTHKPLFIHGDGDTSRLLGFIHVVAVATWNLKGRKGRGFLLLFACLVSHSESYFPPSSNRGQPIRQVQPLSKWIPLQPAPREVLYFGLQHVAAITALVDQEKTRRDVVAAGHFARTTL